MQCKICSLPDDDRRIIEKHILDGSSRKELEEKYGINRTNIWSHKDHKFLRPVKVQIPERQVWDGTKWRDISDPMPHTDDGLLSDEDRKRISEEQKKRDKLPPELRYRYKDYI